MTASLDGALSALHRRRVPACSVEPRAEPGGRRIRERANDFDGKPLLLQRAREAGGTSHSSHDRRVFVDWERAVGEGGEFSGGVSSHRSTTGSVAWSRGPWSRTSLTSAMSRTGIGVAIPQLPEMSRKGGRVTGLPERVTICSWKRPLR